MPQHIEQNISNLIKRFSPLNKISHKYHGQLIEELKLTSYKAGAVIVRKERDKKQAHFLVQGRVEIRESFENRFHIDHENPDSNNAIESILKDRSLVRAVDDCQILSVNTDIIDHYLSWSQDYRIFYLDDSDMVVDDDALIDDDYQEDWDNSFIRSKLAANLSNQVIHQLFSQLEEVIVAANETIIKANSQGDYFYIIKKGEALVQTDADGPYKGAQFSLLPGNYFGDEALVADTTRNASVTMKTSGILGRINAETFNALIKQHLVRPLTTAISYDQSQIKILDVRLPIEYQHGHAKNSDNLPISLLRQKMQTMKESLKYVIGPANDSRSELATYLMRQAGFDAYHLSADLPAA